MSNQPFMKPNNLLLVLCTLGIFLFTQCKKEKEITANAHFYTTDVKKEQSLYLFIDNASFGKLPKLTHEPDCANPKIDSLTLSFPLKSGKYRFEMRDSVGTVYSAATLSFSENKTEGGGSMGSMSTRRSNDNCLLIGLAGLE